MAFGHGLITAIVGDSLKVSLLECEFPSNLILFLLIGSRILPGQSLAIMLSAVTKIVATFPRK